MLGKTLVTDYNAIIPNVTQTMKQSKDFQIEIFSMMGEIILLIPETIAKFFGFGDQSTTTPPPPPEPLDVPTPAITGLIPPLPEVAANFFDWLVGGAQQLYDNMIQGKFTGQQEQTVIEEYLAEVAKIFHDNNEYIAGLKKKLEEEQSNYKPPESEPIEPTTAEQEFKVYADEAVQYHTTLLHHYGQWESYYRSYTNSGGTDLLALANERKNIYLDWKHKFQNFYQSHRNSNNHLIKANANEAYQNFSTWYGWPEPPV